jgi:integrative and conjugative element protein (TIGR02256 family)
MWKRLRTAWVSKTVYDQMITEADRVFPNETGGVLVGYWVVPFQELVVTAVIGPGPRALHEKDRFIPESEYQAAQLARYYQDSGRLHTYLGDWHTHPQSSSCLSRLDRKTLKVIARHPEARAPVPIMGIVAGGTPWTLKLWCGLPIRIGGRITGMRTSSFTANIFRP